MTQHALTTPFGRRTLSFDQIHAQILSRNVVPEQVVHKWKVLQAITTAKQALGLPDRALAVLQALLSFHQETTLQAGEPLIVFPSNEKLIARCHGIAPATLRRHLAILVEAGIIIRRDSPNGKRFARRGQGADDEFAPREAFGFDLAPLVARESEFEQLAQAALREKRVLRLTRERITLARRDALKMIELGLSEALEGPWNDWHMLQMQIISRTKRSDTLAALQLCAEALEELCQNISKHLEMLLKLPKNSAKESHFEHHIQNSKPNNPDSELAPKGDKAKISEPHPPAAEFGIAHVETKSLTPPNLALVIEACPDIADYVPRENEDQAVREGETPRHRVKNWPTFLKAAALVRAMLGISPDAWRDAIETMGEIDASICVAAILQKGDEIKFPGGYLRALSEKKRQNQFSTGPILMALIGGKLKNQARSSL